MLSEIGITQHELSEYADLLLGYQIKKCIEDNGSCSFNAEK
jgi:hypothetical protein